MSATNLYHKIIKYLLTKAQYDSEFESQRKSILLKDDLNIFHNIAELSSHKTDTVKAERLLKHYRNGELKAIQATLKKMIK